MWGLGPHRTPSYSSYLSYWSYRAARGTCAAYWHVADVPGVQGELRPAGVQGAAPLASLAPYPSPNPNPPISQTEGCGATPHPNPISQSALRLSLRRRSLWFRRRRRRRGVLAGLDVIGHLLQACRTRTQTRRTLSGRQRRGRRPTLTHRPRPLTPLTPIRTMPRRQRPRHARPIGTLRRRGTDHRALNGPRHARPIRARLRHRDTPASTRMPRTRATRAVETRRPVGKDPSDQEEGCNQQCHSHGGTPFHTNSITPSPTPRNRGPANSVRGKHDAHEGPQRDTKGREKKGRRSRGCGALPHAPAGRSSPCTPGTSNGRARPGRASGNHDSTILAVLRAVARP